MSPPTVAPIMLACQLTSAFLVLHALASSTATASASGSASATATATASAPIRYDDYQLIEFTPSTARQRRLLNKLQNRSTSHIFLQSSPRPGIPWLAVVAPQNLLRFRQMLRNAFATRIVSHNVQAAIEKDQQQSVAPDQFGFRAYHTLDSIYAWLDQTQRDNPQHVHLLEVGTSYERRSIRGVRISQGPGRPGVLVECGIHAREWISQAFCTYLIHELLTSREPSVRQLAATHDWYVVPSVNPDGYEYTRVDRLWRKTRRPNGACVGADPNRNWDIHWAETVGSSTSSCAQSFAGTAAFSEIEMRTYEGFLRGLTDAKKVHTFITVHSYSQLMLYPYGFSGTPAANKADLQAIGEAAAAGMRRRFGTEYTVGSIHDAIYPVSGCSLDYVYEVLQVPLAYSIELRPKEQKNGFELPAAQIADVGAETMDSLVAMLAEAQARGYNRGDGSVAFAWSGSI